MSQHSVIFFGTPHFACPTLQALYDDPKFDVSLVITQPDKPVGRKKEITPSPVKNLAIELEIPVFQSEDINREFMEIPRHIYQPPDFLVVAAYGQILSNALLSVPKIAPVNVHASFLPQWRGASPIQHSIMTGDRETGITIQRMGEKFDTGPILAQKSIEIEPRETVETLTHKLSKLGACMLIKTLKKSLSEKQQNEDAATYCKKLTREIGDVDPTKMTAEEIDRKVRALVPWPGVRMGLGLGLGSTKNEILKIIETSLEPHPDALELSCAENSILYVVKLQAPGKNVVSGVEWGHNTTFPI